MKQPLIISGNADTVKSLLGIKKNFHWSDYLIINERTFQACEINADYGDWAGNDATLTVEMYEVSVSYKSQEEIAAEEAVRKAQESLKAAEEVLNKVKKEK